MVNPPLTGLRAWLAQRLSAVYLAFFASYLIGHFIFFSPLTYNEWLAWLHSPVITLGGGLFFIALLLHAWIGVRDVILDYAHCCVLLRLILLAGLGGGLLACGLWATRILLGE